MSNEERRTIALETIQKKARKTQLYTKHTSTIITNIKLPQVAWIGARKPETIRDKINRGMVKGKVSYDYGDVSHEASRRI